MSVTDALRERGMGATVLVAAISAAFGVVLISATGFISAMLRADPYLGDRDTLIVVIALMTIILTGVAMYVGAVVTANTFATIVAGRVRLIALMRLIGATARSERRRLSRRGLALGAIGAGLGLVVGLAVSWAGVAAGVSLLGLAGVEYDVAQPIVLIPAVAVVLATWGAAWAGSRRVIAVTPLEALGTATERSHHQTRIGRGRSVGALIFAGVGFVLMAGGVGLGIYSPIGIIPAFLGGLASFTALAIGATIIMPPVLHQVGRWFGEGATARLAAGNAMRAPERSARMSIGVVMGVTLVTMFAVATETAKAVFAANSGGTLPAEFAAVLDTFAAIMMGLVAVSAVIAAVGLVNLLAIGVVQRRRELGLLRAVGLSAAQVRRMVLLEATHITLASLVSGLVLGLLYGWVGAQSLLGSVPTTPGGNAGSLVLPAMPWAPVIAVVLAMALLTIVAAVTPTRMATRVTPIAALAEG